MSLILFAINANLYYHIANINNKPPYNKIYIINKNLLLTQSDRTMKLALSVWLGGSNTMIIVNKGKLSGT